MTRPIDAAARAFVAVAIVAMIADALLAAFTGAAAAAGGEAGSPWWVTAHVLERGRWVLFALFSVAAARLIPVGGLAAAAGTRGAVWRAVGAAAIAVPLLWIAATWAVQAALFTVAGRWAIDGAVFLTAAPYRRALVGYAPWLLAGAAAIVAARHVE